METPSTNPIPETPKKKLSKIALVVALIPGTLISDKSAAAALSISRSHFWGHLVKNNKLKPVKLSPRTTRFRADDVIALIAA